jgi:hypothetical protein
MRGAAAIIVGFTTARLSMSLGMRPSIATVWPILTWPEVSTLPKLCDSGSHRYSRSASVRKPTAAMASAV